MDIYSGRGRMYERAYIRDVNWVTYFGGVYSGMGGINEILL